MSCPSTASSVSSTVPASAWSRPGRNVVTSKPNAPRLQLASHPLSPPPALARCLTTALHPSGRSTQHAAEGPSYTYLPDRRRIVHGDLKGVKSTKAASLVVTRVPLPFSTPATAHGQPNMPLRLPSLVYVYPRYATRCAPRRPGDPAILVWSSQSSIASMTRAGSVRGQAPGPALADAGTDPEAAKNTVESESESDIYAPVACACSAE
ncbi:hypothetical protein LshimejAT787_0700090 [Lyophyllum shimeji]|uniref:Uncharacterized protein n=1 Tax=Lyophyllum shimeji TaxID=47721 RepID=A0A9P3PQ19_LYOSH|nr:hypothetical protein LshimejAT787_0700090 [Lyophyllum shimeji]